MKEVNPKMITVAAQSRGMNYAQLAEKINVEPGTLSKIVNGNLKVKPEILAALSDVLEFPIEFFYEEINVLSPNPAHYRKRKTLNLKNRLLVETNVFIKKHLIKKMLASINLETNIFDFSPYDCGSPENVARLVRQKWHVPAGPIPNLVQLIERAGIIVLYNETNDEKFSGECMPDEDGIKLIYVNKDHDVARQRYTLAHELGHIIMHSFDFTPFTEEEAEGQADAFASEFLMPELEIAPYLSGINIAKAGELKAHWKCSMAAIITRAYKLKFIDKNRWTSLFMQLSQNGWRKGEPDFGMKPEIPGLINRLFEIHIRQLGYTDEDFAKLFSLNIDEATKIRHFYYPSSLKIA
jgi:Zn-dependent peptidase ImmA (M78 family)/transcriptional regulator with XRE-family HTH domain